MVYVSLMVRAMKVGTEQSSVVRALTSSRSLSLLVLTGIGLRLWAYASNTALWLDEILLSRNILELPLGQLLTQPLQLDQVAPRGFLLVEKLAVLALGKTELALRLFPFLCGIASLLLFRRLAERALTGLAVPFAVALFALGVPFISYSVQVKQYIVDATAAILLLYLALGIRGDAVPTRRLVMVGIVGLAVSWFSQASVLVMAGIGVAFGIAWLVRRDRPAARVLLITMPLWAAAALIAIVVGMKSMTPATREFMDDFWRSGFFPLPLRSLTQLRWFWDQGLSVFTDQTLLRYPWPALYLVLAVVGLAVTLRRHRDVGLMLLAPIVIALVAAIAHQYPFRGRLMFYLLPIVILAIAAGAEWIRSRLGRLTPALGGAAMVALLVSPVMVIARTLPPYELEHWRTMLTYLQQKREPGDIIHVFPLMRVGTLFYGSRFGLTRADWTTAACDRNETRPFVVDVDRYRGSRRVWVLAANQSAYRSAHTAVREYLGTIGVRRDGLVLPSLTRGVVTLDLYDLSDSARLASASAATFPVPPMPTAPRPGCRPWIKPSRLDSALIVR